MATEPCTLHSVPRILLVFFTEISYLLIFMDIQKT